MDFGHPPRISVLFPAHIHPIYRDLRSVLSYNIVTPRRAAWIGATAVLAYVAWIGGPYLNSIFVRDAAVTTWLYVATAPVAGELDATALCPGKTVGSDGTLATLVNPRVDRSALAHAEAELAAATARATQFDVIAATKRARRQAYVAEYERELDQRIETNERTLTLIMQRCETQRAEAARAERLLQTGSASTAAAEAARAAFAAAEAERATIEGDLKRSRLRRESTEHGVYLAEDGNESDWSARHDPLLLERESLDLAQTTAAARAKVVAANEFFERQQRATMNVPPGAVVWNRLAAPGAHVEAGAPVASWIDPTVLLVDAPVSDLEISLLTAGTRAQVMIEGERRPREGVVLVTRGSSAPLNAHELATTARGRRPGTAQVIVRLESSPAVPDRLAIGHPAYVSFPSVSVLRLLIARLRL